MFYDSFKKICKEKGVKPTKVVTDIGLSSSNMTNWKNGRTPKTDVAQRIADYLGVSLDYLLGNTNSQDDELNEYLEELRNRSEMRMLFSVSKGATKEEVEQAVKIIEALRKND